MKILDRVFKKYYLFNPIPFVKSGARRSHYWTEWFHTVLLHQ